LVALAALTALTGARTPVVWFKICPVLLGGSAALLVAASLISAVNSLWPPRGAGGLLEEAGDEGRCLHAVWAA
jgi:hypothetical protein